MNTPRTEGIIAGAVVLLVIIATVAYASYAHPAPAQAPTAPAPVATSTTPVSSPVTTQPLPPAPIATTTPSPSPTPPGMQVITAADHANTVSLADHERFEIQLGSTLSWTVSFDPASGITRVANSTTANGIQGVYEAEAPGTVTMTAIGAPICAPRQPCPQFLQEVSVTFLIR